MIFVEYLSYLYTKRALDTKLFTLDTESDALNLLYKISQHKLVSHKYNDLRPFVIGDKFEHEPYQINVTIVNMNYPEIFYKNFIFEAQNGNAQSVWLSEK